MTRTARWLLTASVVVALAVAATFVIGIGGGPRTTTPEAAGTTASGVSTKAADPLPATAGVTAGLPAKIQFLQDHLRVVKTDANGWATLGLDYVEQARATVDPAYYPKAEAVLKTSLDLQPADNFVACAGEAALASARHDFATALSWAKKGVAINSFSAALYGTLGDAQTQLGMYDAAATSIQKMVDLRPGTPSFARASYIQELRGDVAGAMSSMQAALDAAATPANKAFANYYLGELSVNAGDPAKAMTFFAEGITQDPSFAALHEGKARAEAALGKTGDAVKDFADAVGRVPQPTYVLEYADYLTSLGRKVEAAQQYKVFLAENALFESNGVQLDTDATLYYADHGDPAKALTIGAAGLKTRPFLEMLDAYGWALHAAGRDTEALVYAEQAVKPGMRNALFHFHLGMIHKALGQTPPARAELTLALRINPHFNPLEAPIARAALTALGAKA